MIKNKELIKSVLINIFAKNLLHIDKWFFRDERNLKINRLPILCIYFTYILFDKKIKTTDLQEIWNWLLESWTLKNICKSGEDFFGDTYWIRKDFISKHKERVEKYFSLRSFDKFTGKKDIEKWDISAWTIISDVISKIPKNIIYDMFFKTIVPRNMGYIEDDYIIILFLSLLEKKLRKKNNKTDLLSLDPLYWNSQLYRNLLQDDNIKSLLLRKNIMIKNYIVKTENNLWWQFLKDFFDLFKKEIKEILYVSKWKNRIK